MDIGEEERFEVFPVDDGRDSSSNSSTDDDVSTTTIDIQLILIVATAMKAYLTMIECFEPIKLSRENQSSVIHDLLERHIGHEQQFKDLTNFTVEEFEELCRYVCPYIMLNARSTGACHTVSGRPCKLTPEQWLMSFVLYLKHDNTVNFDASHWNWCRAAICNDALFVATCVNQAINNEIRWPTLEERRLLGDTSGETIPQLPSYIGIVDGTLVKIRRPFENPRHKKWFQGRKKCTI